MIYMWSVVSDGLKHMLHTSLSLIVLSIRLSDLLSSLLMLCCLVLYDRVLLTLSTALTLTNTNTLNFTPSLTWPLLFSSLTLGHSILLTLTTARLLPSLPHYYQSHSLFLLPSVLLTVLFAHCPSDQRTHRLTQSSIHSIQNTQLIV